MNGDTTRQLQGCFDRMHSGETAARSDLIDYASGRLVYLTKVMISGFPRVQRWAQAEDVAQAAAMRLCKALETIEPKGVHEFLGLAKRQIRWELLALTERYREWLGQSVLVSEGADGEGAGAYGPMLPPDSRIDTPSELMVWTEFHSRVETLPEDERQVVDLLWYEGLTQEEAAELLDVSPKWVQRRWLTARQKLGRFLSSNMAS